MWEVKLILPLLVYFGLCKRIQAILKCLIGRHASTPITPDKAFQEAMKARGIVANNSVFGIVDNLKAWPPCKWPTSVIRLIWFRNIWPRPLCLIAQLASVERRVCSNTGCIFYISFRDHTTMVTIWLCKQKCEHMTGSWRWLYWSSMCGIQMGGRDRFTCEVLKWCFCVCDSFKGHKQY